MSDYILAPINATSEYVQCNLTIAILAVFENAAIQDMASNLTRKWRTLLPTNQAKPPAPDGSSEGESRRFALRLETLIG